MDLSVRLIFLAIGAFIIIAIFVDYFRRNRLLKETTSYYMGEAEAVSEPTPQIPTIKAPSGSLHAFSDLGILEKSAPVADEVSEENWNPKIEPSLKLAPRENVEKTEPSVAIKKETVAEVREETKKVEPVKPKNIVIVVHVMAPENYPFIGYELLQALLAANLHYGRMNIFHCMADAFSEEYLFSVAQAKEPGVFDIDNMGAIACEGLSLFIEVSKVSNPMQALDAMINVARQLAEDLGGYLLGADQQPLTAETIAAYRHQIAENFALA